MWETVVLWPRKVVEHCKGSLKGHFSRKLEDTSVGSNVDYTGKPNSRGLRDNNSSLETMLVMVRQRTWLLLLSKKSA